MEIKPELLSWAQIDITARCQAMCLDCARNIKGVELNPEIGTSDTWDMPIEILKKFLSLKMLSSLERIRFNGNFGDSLLHQDFFNILKYVVQLVQMVQCLMMIIIENCIVFLNHYVDIE